MIRAGDKLSIRYDGRLWYVVDYDGAWGDFHFEDPTSGSVVLDAKRIEQAINDRAYGKVRSTRGANQSAFASLTDRRDH